MNQKNIFAQLRALEAQQADKKAASTSTWGMSKTSDSIIKELRDYQSKDETMEKSGWIEKTWLYKLRDATENLKKNEKSLEVWKKVYPFLKWTIDEERLQRNRRPIKEYEVWMFQMLGSLAAHEIRFNAMSWVNAQEVKDWVNDYDRRQKEDPDLKDPSQEDIWNSRDSKEKIHEYLGRAILELGLQKKRGEEPQALTVFWDRWWSMQTERMERMLTAAWVTGGKVDMKEMIQHGHLSEDLKNTWNSQKQTPQSIKALQSMVWFLEEKGFEVLDKWVKEGKKNEVMDFLTSKINMNGAMLISGSFQWPFLWSLVERDHYRGLSGLQAKIPKEWWNEACEKIKNEMPVDIQSLYGPMGWGKIPFKILKTLEKMGAKIDVQDSKGNHFLHYWAQYPSFKQGWKSWMRERNEWLCLVNQEGKTPKDIIISRVPTDLKKQWEQSWAQWEKEILAETLQDPLDPAKKSLLKL